MKRERDKESLTHAITTKVTEAEFKQLEPLWQASGMSRSQWCRNALLSQLGGNSGAKDAMTLVLAELLALRTIAVNLLHSLGSGEPITREKLTNLTELADREKFRRALDRLRQCK
jgi:hypothetical protein